MRRIDERAAVLLADVLRTALREQDSPTLRQLLDTGTGAIQAPTLGALLAYTHRHPHAQWTSRSDLPDAVARAVASDDTAVRALARDLARILPTTFAELGRQRRSAADVSSADLQRYQDVCSATADWWVRCLDNQSVLDWSFRDLTTEQFATFRAVLMARLPAGSPRMARRWGRAAIGLRSRKACSRRPRTPPASSPSSGRTKLKPKRHLPASGPGAIATPAASMSTSASAGGRPTSAPRAP